MLGTIVNTGAIIVGTLLGALLHRGIHERYKTALYEVLGLASLAIGLNACVSNFAKSRYPVLFIVAMAVGTVVGTWMDVDGRFHRLVERRSAAGGRLADGLATATLLYCIGPLSMLGPVIAALRGDQTFLFTNATLDLVSSTIFASTYGLGMLLAAPVLFVWQGLFYVVARLSSQAVSDQLMAELLIVGGLMIAASGFNLLGMKKLKVLDMLPALLVPVVWFVALYLAGIIQ